jgi:hypothetical protein
MDTVFNTDLNNGENTKTDCHPVIYSYKIIHCKYERDSAVTSSVATPKSYSSMDNECSVLRNSVITVQIDLSTARDFRALNLDRQNQLTEISRQELFRNLQSALHLHITNANITATHRTTSHEHQIAMPITLKTVQFYVVFNQSQLTSACVSEEKKTQKTLKKQRK